MAEDRAREPMALEPLRFPLRGQRLIEASAGTGKTFTLALLYTRLVLGHGPQGSGFGRALMPPEILVVTFTEAATKELRARIRARLVEAAAVFADAESASGCEDALLLQLRNDYPRDDWPACAYRLQRAAQWMDEAMIATIHGWCQRMLQEHAFATRGLFHRELVADQSEPLAEALRDYWRLHCYPLPADQARCLQEIVPSPDALFEKLGTWVRPLEAVISHAGRPVHCPDLQPPLAAQCRQRAREEAVEALQDAARALWRERREEVETLLWELREHLNGTAHGSAKPESFHSLLNELADWSQGGEAPGRIKSFAQGAFKFKAKAAVQTEPEHAVFQAIADWKAEEQRLSDESLAPDPPLEACLLAHAADWLRRELPRRLGERAEMGFDDLLRDLDKVLNPAQPTALEQAQALNLARTLRRQFPVALIDEFQDTDPLQYRLFERIYAEAPESVTAPLNPAGDSAGEPSALVMIGDPKQAIYSFRGADIHAYLRARRASADRPYSLERNFRSTAGMVAACNQLFAHADRHPRGAFRFREPETGVNPIPYLRVQAAGRAETLVCDGRACPAMTMWWFEGDGEQPVGVEHYRQRMAEAAAAQVRRWVEQGRRQTAGFQGPESFQPLRPRDIAMLVRTGKEAALIREALSARGVNSVYLSDRDSVFATAEAVDLVHWLRACAAPHDEALVRAALATNTLALPLETLARLEQDELGWEEQLERFRQYRAIWQRQGVLAAVHRLMHDAELPGRQSARPGGERTLTNLLHLAEWLQQAATEIDGEQALVRHLSEHLGKRGEEFVVRLESDAELVQVITIHKSKGLEYPLVLLPFVCAWRDITGRDAVVTYRPQRSADDLRRYQEVAGKKHFPEAWAQADDARLSEDMRLFYVAVTRARHAVWLGVAPVANGRSKTPRLERSALGYALNGEAEFPSVAAVRQALEALGAGCPEIAIEPLPVADALRLTDAAGRRSDPPREPSHRPFEPWWIASYSALRLGMAATAQAPTEGLGVGDLDADTPDQETAREEAAAADQAFAVASAAGDGQGLVGADSPFAPEAASAARSLHGFPRGSRYGTFLHGLFEWAGAQQVRDESGCARRGFEAAAHSAPLRRDMLQRRCALNGLHGWAAPLTHWLGDMLTRSWRLPPPSDLASSPLGGGGRELPDAAPAAPQISLRSLKPEQVRLEMEFWIQAHRVDTQALDRLVQQHCLPGHARPSLLANQLNGMLKGFIDLVFESEGLFFVLDWKSNWLGPDDSAYTREAMCAAVLHHRYDLQYVLYLLALHRLLSARLPDYSYERHVGGALYVFLRGADAASQGLFADRPPRALIEDLDRLFAGSGGEAQGVGG